MSPIINKFIEEYFPKLINAYLALDPESQQRLLKLNGKIVTIELAKHPIQLQFTQSGISLKTEHFSEPHTTIKGSPLSLLHITLARDNRKNFFSDNSIVIEGNLELGQQVIALFDELEVDWEEYLSHGLGDVGSHQLVRFTRKIKQFGQRIFSTLTENIDEYVHEEADLFPPSEALNDFYRDVDELRMDTDRLDARIRKLSEKISRNKQ
jgi:ubiquinone biosynthesis protein UbiJ